MEMLNFLILVSVGMVVALLTIFSFIKFKNIYLKAAPLSMGTLAFGVSIFIFAWTGWAQFPFRLGPDFSFFLAVLFIWPTAILSAIEIGIFGNDLFAPEYKYLEYFHFAVAQYLGYFGLLMLIRWFKNRKAKKP